MLKGAPGDGPGPFDTNLLREDVVQDLDRRHYVTSVLGAGNENALSVVGEHIRRGVSMRCGVHPVRGPGGARGGGRGRGGLPAGRALVVRAYRSGCYSERRGG
jgi:hypothetical protein